MRNLVLLFLITILFFSCTIEKRRYFKGYHVENGRMGPFDRLRDRGNGEVRKRESGEEGKRGPSTSSGNRILRQAQEPEEEVQQQTTACETSETNAASPASEDPKPQRGEIVIEEDIVKDDITMDDIAKNDESPKPQRGDIVIEDDVARGGDVVDVTRVIFGMLSIVSFALALLFFGSAIFAIDSLVMTVLLLIGGGFALAGLVFLVIYALIKRKQSLSGHVVGQTNEPEPANPKPKRVRNALIPFVICGLFVLLAGLKLGSGQLGLIEAIEYLAVFVGYAFLAVILLIVTIVRLVRKRKQARLLKEPMTPPSSPSN